jgi:hypothetical protein
MGNREGEMLPQNSMAPRRGSGDSAAQNPRGSGRSSGGELSEARVPPGMFRGRLGASKPSHIFFPGDPAVPWRAGCFGFWSWALKIVIGPLMLANFSIFSRIKWRWSLRSSIN